MSSEGRPDPSDVCLNPRSVLCSEGPGRAARGPWRTVSQHSGAVRKDEQPHRNGGKGSDQSAGRGLQTPKDVPSRMQEPQRRAAPTPLPNHEVAQMKRCCPPLWRLRGGGGGSIPRLTGGAVKGQLGHKCTWPLSQPSHPRLRFTDTGTVNEPTHTDGQSLKSCS